MNHQLMSPITTPQGPPLWLLVMITFSGTLAMHMFVPALPIVAQDLGASTAATQGTVSLYIAGLAAGQLIYGPLSDYYGRRPILMIGLALYTTAGIAAALAQGVHALVAARFVQGLGGCAGLVLGRAIVRDTTVSQDAARRLALMNLVVVIGPALGPLLGGMLSTSLGWRSIVLLLVALGMTNILLVWRCLQETARPIGTVDVLSIARDYNGLLRSPAFLGYSIGGGCAVTSIYAYIAAAPFIFTKELHRPLHETGVYLGLLAVGISLGSALASRLIGRVSIEQLMCGANALSVVAAVALLGIVLLGGLTVTSAAGLMFLFALGSGMSGPAALTKAVSVNPAVIGSAAGLYGCAQMVVGALCTLVASLGQSPALAAASALATAATLGQIAFWVALRHEADTGSA